MMESELTEMVLKYQTTGEGFRELMDCVGTFVYEYPSRRRRWDHDDRADFFCYFFPKVPALIDRFEYTGKPFEAYLCASMKWQMKTFITKKIMRERQSRIITEEIFWVDQDAYSIAANRRDHEWVGEAGDGPIAHTRIQASDLDEATRKRILCLFMRAAEHADEKQVKRVADITGYDADWISHCVATLHAMLESKRSRSRAYRTRRDHAFFRARVIRDKLAEEKDPVRRSRLARTLQEERRRFDRVTRKMARSPVEPTHREIAEVLGIPKGTVDSALHYIRRATASGTVPRGMHNALHGDN